MSRIDEPALGTDAPGPRSDGQRNDDRALPDRIRALLEAEPYAVLCTQGEMQPYGSLVAFAFTPDLTAATFATPVTTRKYELLSACDRVSLVVDNRARFGDELSRLEATTVTGRAVRLERGVDFEPWAERLLERHGYLGSFLAAPSTALFRVDVVRFFHVERFQEVRQWIPTPAG